MNLPTVDFWSWARASGYLVVIMLSMVVLVNWGKRFYATPTAALFYSVMRITTTFMNALALSEIRWWVEPMLTITEWVLLICIAYDVLRYYVWSQRRNRRATD